MDPRVWIHTKLSWIRNTACKPVKHVKYFDIIFLLLPRTCRNDGCDAHIIEDSITSVQGFGSQITGINHQIFITSIIVGQLQTVKIPHPIADFPANVFFLRKPLHFSGENECGSPTLPITAVSNKGEVKNCFLHTGKYYFLSICGQTIGWSWPAPSCNLPEGPQDHISQL
jgi:hypothetical protein